MSDTRKAWNRRATLYQFALLTPLLAIPLLLATGHAWGIWLLPAFFWFFAAFIMAVTLRPQWFGPVAAQADIPKSVTLRYNSVSAVLFSILGASLIPVLSEPGQDRMLFPAAVLVVFLFWMVACARVTARYRTPKVDEPDLSGDGAP